MNFWPKFLKLIHGPAGCFWPVVQSKRTQSTLLLILFKIGTHPRQSCTAVSQWFHVNSSQMCYLHQGQDNVISISSNSKNILLYMGLTHINEL